MARSTYVYVVCDGGEDGGNKPLAAFTVKRELVNALRLYGLLRALHLNVYRVRDAELLSGTTKLNVRELLEQA